MSSYLRYKVQDVDDIDEVPTRPASEADLAPPNAIVPYTAYAWGSSGDIDEPRLIEPIPASPDIGCDLIYRHGENRCSDKSSGGSLISFLFGPLWPDGEWLSSMFINETSDGGDCVGITKFDEGKQSSTFQLDDTANTTLFHGERKIIVGVCTQSTKLNRIIVEPGDIRLTALVPGERRSAYFHLFFMRNSDIGKVLSGVQSQGNIDAELRRQKEITEHSNKKQKVSSSEEKMTDDAGAMCKHETDDEADNE